MLTINTNLSSLIVQSNLKSSSNGLNNAIERMTTGYKINHAKDNSANFSISTSLTTKLGAYSIAEDNAMMGLDMVQTASSSLSLMSDLGSRLRALATQAQNGTYGADSMTAINKEATSIISELARIKNTTEYNGMKLLGSAQNSGSAIAIQSLANSAKTVAVQSTENASKPTPPKAKSSGFIEDVQKRDTRKMTKVADVSGTTPITGGTYSISSAEELVKFAEMSNKYMIQGGEFVLAGDIDMSGVTDFKSISVYDNWPITFDGNGYKISNLEKALFSKVSGNIKNLGLVNANIQSGYGVLATGIYADAEIFNCYAQGSINASDRSGGLIGNVSAPNNTVNVTSCYTNVEVTSSNLYVGGLIGKYDGSGNIKNCYSTGSVNGKGHTGGLIGDIYGAEYVENCYATGTVNGQNDSDIGGLIGRCDAKNVSNCFATGNVRGDSYTGGLLGNSGCSLSNCYATGTVEGDSYTGGLVGESQGNIENCYATGNIIGTNYTGGLVGYNYLGNITTCYATGNVTSNSGSCVGGLVGNVNNNNVIDSCYATGNISAKGNEVGGLVGRSYGKTISNCYATGNVTSDSNQVGGLIGWSVSNTDSCYTTGKVTGKDEVGGLMGCNQGGSINYSYTTSTVTGNNNVGGVAGTSYSNIDKTYANGKVNGNSTVGGFIGTGYGTITDGYFNIDTTGQTIGVASGNATAIGISSKELKDLIADGTLPYFQPTGNDFTLQVGINSDSSNQIEFTIQEINLSVLDGLQIESAGALEAIDSVLKAINEQQTNLGSIENRLSSALESIGVSINNLTSTQSTTRDADIAEVSSEYIRNQILQQASATLLATANQTPAIALQLI